MIVFIYADTKSYNDCHAIYSNGIERLMHFDCLRRASAHSTEKWNAPNCFGHKIPITIAILLERTEMLDKLI